MNLFYLNRKMDYSTTFGLFDLVSKKHVGIKKKTYRLIYLPPTVYLQVGCSFNHKMAL